MNELSGYVFSPLREGDIALHRGSASGLAPILLVAADESSRGCVERLEHEYALKAELDGGWAARPVALTHYNDRMTLVLEDPGGAPLDRLLGQPLEVSHFLRIAIPLAGALRHVHERGLIHKDIKPANILVESASSSVWLTGFGIASRLPRERQAPAPPEVIAGTLAYMAPEQTGRMNRSVDSRSDLYALGVTLYEMLAGTLPFTAADPMEWVHCHIARQPMPPDERVAGVPEPLSAIVMKLLAKTGEERYQTAAGVEADLRRCLAEWESHGRIEPFSLGGCDVSDRLLIPEKLYGREREIDTLLASFDRVVANGTPELVLVSGYSGIGKSSVVNELHKVMVPPRGLFASGKFDQYKRDIPYSTLAQAFESLVRPLLSKSDAELASWRDALREALGPNGQIMVDLVPELKLIIGEQPAVPDFPPQDAQRRFQLVFRRFIGVFARPEHPLTLFFDDLQWLDAATLELLEDLLTRSDVQHLLVIGAYRDNEVDATHPLARKLQAIRNTGAKIHEITLAPLACEHLGQLLADALRRESKRVVPLAQLVHEKTGGNPFFAIQFISALAEEGLLRFDHDAACWSWNLDRIRAEGYTDNVVELMVGKLARLPRETQAALRQLACVGNAAEVTMLLIAFGTSEAQVHADLREAVRLGLVERQEGAYKFVHDRVQEAAYSLIPEASRAEAHLRIGRLLAAQTPLEKREELIFEIVNQLNRGAALIAAQDEREQLAELNLVAGKRAKASTAYAAAQTYITAGCALLPEDCWEHCYALTFSLEFHLAECEFLIGALVAAENRLAILSSRGRRLVDFAAVTCLRSSLYTTLDRSDRAVEVCLDYLRQVGIQWSARPTSDEVRQEYERIWQQIAGRPIKELADLPLMTDPECRATLDVLAAVLMPARITDDNLVCLTVSRMANLSLEHGNSDGSCIAYVWVGSMIAGPRFGDYQAAFQFGQLGYDLVEQRGLTRFQAGTYMSFGNVLLPWTRHVRAARDPLRRAFEAANQSGDLNFAASCCSQLNTNLIAAGDPLDEVQGEAERGLAFAQKMRFGIVIDVITGQLGLIRTLRGLTPTFGSFDEEGFDERLFERHLANNPALALAEDRYWIRKLQARFFAGSYASAIVAAANAERLLWISRTVFEGAEYHFYAALARAAVCNAASAAEQAQLKEALAVDYRLLQEWADNCPENFANRAALVAAEIARLEGRELDAERLYEQAIRSAHVNGFIHNEALADELAAGFYAARGFDKIARVYLRDARYGYLRWGADGKVRQLEQLHPHLRDAPVPASRTATIGAPVERLDVGTVLKAAQAVSGEIVLGELIKTLLRIAVEHAGAGRGLLILCHGDEPQIAAEATTGRGQVEVALRQAAVSPAELPESLLHYVIRTRDSVILDDALAQNPFSADEYICQKHARSVLCLPLVKQSKLIGVLYLENNLASHVFTPARISVLELLASQAAISLENARLYNDLREREARIRRLVDSNIIGIFIGDSRGGILEANEAFLDILGYNREDLISGRIRWTKLTPAEWAPADQDALAQMSATGGCKPFEKEYFRKDGSRVPVLVGGAFFEVKRDEGVVFVIDMTDRKRAEQALRESEERFRTLVQFSFDVYWESDAQHRFIRQEFAEGLADPPAPGSEIGKTRWEVPHLEPDAEAWRKHRETLEAHLPFRDFELARPAADGGKRYISVSGLPVFDKAGRFIGYRGVARHITERKRAEEALRHMQMQLAHANRVATMGQLSASITHEVKQPIATARNNARAALNFLDKDPPDLDEVREALGCIVGDADRAGDIVDRIRELIKKEPPRKECLDINAGIREVIELTRGESVKNGISMQADLADGLPLIEGDRVQLQQVILNLIVNAVEAMSGAGDGTRELLVSSRKADPGGVLVGVRDSGPGLAPETFGHVFDAFYTTKPGGLGMGLSICRSIIEAHGGRLWASANLPRGASFQFALPAIANTAS
jgi:PAS domain S-box-containing protein